MEELFMKAQQRKRIPLHIALLVICLLVCSGQGIGVIKGTGSSVAFESNLLKSSSVNQFVVEGASYFLKSHSSYLALLQQIEISEIEYIPLGILNETADTAISKMQDTISAYAQLKAWADVTPYNEDVVSSLKLFNYMEFQREHNLSPAIFWKVREYLKNGDVRGIYDKMLEDSNSILKSLAGIGVDLTVGKIPSNISLWSLNQFYLECLMFDQYVSMVFYAIM
jgi:hypothetical protein